MKIAINDYGGFPFPFDLSRELVRRGHQVQHLYTMSSGGPKSVPQSSGQNGLEIQNLGIDSAKKDDFIKRWYQEFNYGRMTITQLDHWQPQLIISANTPLVAQNRMINWSRKRSIPFVFWLQDLLSLAAKSILYKRFGPFALPVSKYFENIERHTLRKANYIVTITESFIQYLKKWNINTQKISVIHNWSPIEDIPALPRENDFSAKFGLNQKFVILYAGTLGLKQDPKLIVKTAQAFIEDKSVVFAIATDARGQSYLKKEMGSKSLPNVLMLQLQPIRVLPYMLASADILLSVLEDSAGTFCVPSKVWSGFCAARPSLLIVRDDNLAARITLEIRAGLVISPGWVDGVVSAINYLKEKPLLRERMAKNARRYAEQNFSISKITDSFESIFRSLLK
jgi:colanic acid biosynthesis glycosyl transferase WcaI